MSRDGRARSCAGPSARHDAGPGAAPAPDLVYRHHPSFQFATRLADNRIRAAVVSTGDGFDNVLNENLWSTLKRAGVSKVVADPATRPRTRSSPTSAAGTARGVSRSAWEIGAPGTPRPSRGPIPGDPRADQRQEDGPSSWTHDGTDQRRRPDPCWTTTAPGQHRGPGPYWTTTAPGQHRGPGPYWTTTAPGQHRGPGPYWTTTAPGQHRGPGPYWTTTAPERHTGPARDAPQEFACPWTEHSGNSGVAVLDRNPAPRRRGPPPVPDRNPWSRTVVQPGVTGLRPAGRSPTLRRRG